MKINAASIFGLALAAAGVLLLILGFREHGDPGVMAGHAFGRGFYWACGAGGIIGGALIIWLGQSLRRSPPP